MVRCEKNGVSTTLTDSPAPADAKRRGIFFVSGRLSLLRARLNFKIDYLTAVMLAYQCHDFVAHFIAARVGFFQFR
jgi:hypothetical protein